MDPKNEMESSNTESPTPTIPDVAEVAVMDKTSEITGPGYQSQQVRSVMLMDVPIVALVIDGQERLCLAQISNTLLRKFSYNEIHNRRVALGITCLQCTPVQLEILRRAGAMPVSSRRCGMITRREADRLCKSFLIDQAPPRLPDDYAFEVGHKCAYGCRGRFLPSRYNSSRAKCVQCIQCGLFFSPNKFIFHSHRRPDASYVQPDAANFNAWRRHLNLSEKNPSEDLLHAWEDVKAMFNGGSRKRMNSPIGTDCAHLLLPKLQRNSLPIGDTQRKSAPSGASDAESKRIITDNSFPANTTKPCEYPVPSFAAFASLSTPAPFCWPCPPVNFSSSLLFPHHPHTSLLSPPLSSLMPGSLGLPKIQDRARNQDNGDSEKRRASDAVSEDSHAATSAFREFVSSAASTPSPTQHQNTSDGDSDSKPNELSAYTSLTKEKLQELLISEIQARRKLETDLQALKDAFLSQCAELRRPKH